MDFITKLPKTRSQHDDIMVVVDKLTKAYHFILIKSTHKATENKKGIYMKELSRLHGIPKSIVLERDSKFTGHFWKCLFKGFGTNLNMSTSHHPWIDGQTKMVNYVIEDILRMYVMDQTTKWENYLHLVEFAYNNGYHSSLKLSPL